MLRPPSRASRTVSLALATLAMAAAMALPASALPIVNGDFESGDTGFSSSFAVAPPASILDANTYAMVDDPSSVHGSAASYGDHTSGTGLMLMVNGSNTGEAVVWSQTVSVTAGQAYEFSFWSSTWFTNAGLRVEINGDVVGTFSTPGATGVWEQSIANWNAGASSSASIEIINTTSGFTGNDFALDDISFVVPEPGTAGLVLGGLALLQLRRRRRS